MRARERLYDRYGDGGYGAGGEPPCLDEDPHDLKVEYVRLLAGRGALETAAQNLGSTISLPAEKDPVNPVARAMLHRKFPVALIVTDFGDADWHDWIRNSTAALGVLAGPPCGPYAPSGKGYFLSDP